MDELLALQRELAEVQSAPSVVRLSEPNIVEMMLKLKDLGLVDVLHTSNGKEYLTPKQLRNEVADEILAHNGRINITELAPILNVDLPYVEHAVDELLKKEEGGLQLFQGELIASYYLDSLAEEINQTLQGSGRVTLAELAVQHVLPTEFMQKVIEPRLNTVVKAKLASGVLYTSAYVDRHAARVRGVLCACLRPTSLAQLIRDHGFNEALFYECVESLRASKMLPGSVQGKSSYTPSVHAHAQVSGVKSFYEQNGLIEYASLSRMGGVRDPAAYLEQNYPGGIKLATCYMKRDLLEGVEAEVDEVCANAWALDVRASFTHELSDEDVDALINASTIICQCLSGGKAVRLSRGSEDGTSGLVASSALVSSCGEAKELEELVTKTAEHDFQKGTASSQHAQAGGAKGAAAKGAAAKGSAAKKGSKGSKADDDDDDDDGKRSKGGGKRGKAAARDMLLLDGGGLEDSDDDDLQGGGGGKKGKGGKKGGKKDKGKAGGGGGGGGGDAADADGDENDDGESSALLEGVEAALLAHKPALEEISGLSNALARRILPSVSSRVAEAVKVKREAGAGERRKALQGAQEAVGTLATNVQLFAKGLIALSDKLQGKDCEALDKAMLKGCCTDLLVALLYSEALHAGVEPPKALSAAASGAVVSAADRKEALAALPGPPQRALSELEKAVAAKAGSVTSFLDAFKQMEETLGAQCPPLDKKKEKAAIDKARAAFRTQLGEESIEPAIALHLAVTLLHIDLNGILIEAPEAHAAAYRGARAKAS